MRLHYSKVAKETGYENIFNIINSEDFVTRVPLERWGYSRYGIDLVLPSSTFYGDGYEKIYSGMNSKFVALTGQNFKPYDEDKNEGTIPVRNLVENVSTLSLTVKSF